MCIHASKAGLYDGTGRRSHRDKRLGAGFNGKLLLFPKSSLSARDESLAGDGECEC